MGKLMSGGWKTTVAHKQTAITGNELVNATKFRISCDEFVDGSPVQFRLKTDTAFPLRMLEGGGIILDAKTLLIEQLDPTQMHIGSWEAIGGTDVPFAETTWSAPAATGSQVSLAAVAAPTTFVVSYEYSKDPNHAETDSQIKIMVDGQYLKDSGGVSAALWIQGSSVICVGKRVDIEVASVVAGQTRVRGSVKVALP